MGNSYIIVGLGNPGKDYINTRHNIGFEVIDFLANKLDVSRVQEKHTAFIGETRLDGKRIYLVKPQTYMNLSGQSVREIVEWHKPSLDNLIVVYDDVDFELGRIKIRKKGSSGTHNGMKSIICCLNSDEFPRVRVGIGKNPERMSLSNYVLSRFAENERDIVKQTIENAGNAVIELIKNGSDTAMNKYNK